jgi:hypothetical protein
LAARFLSCTLNLSTVEQLIAERVSLAVAREGLDHGVAFIVDDDQQVTVAPLNAVELLEAVLPICARNSGARTSCGRGNGAEG